MQLDQNRNDNNNDIESKPLNSDCIISQTTLNDDLKECEPSNKIKVWAFGLLYASSGFLLGFCIAQFNNFFQFFARGKFGETLPPKDYDNVQSILNGCLVGGALLSSLTAGYLLKYVSTRLLSLLCILVIFLATTLQIWVPLELLYLCRVFIGYVIIFYTYSGPVMIIQCLPGRFIGPLGSIFGLFLNLGVLIAYTVTSDISEDYWEVFLSLPVFFEFIRFVILIFCFYIESPFYVYSSLIKSIKKAGKNSGIDIKSAFMKDQRVENW